MLLYDKPRIVFGENMIDKSYCNEIISFGKNQFKTSKSFSVDQNTDIIDDWRTSSTFVDTKDYCKPLRTFALDIGIKHFINYQLLLSNIELTQIQRYNKLQYYKFHCDYYNYNSRNVDNDRIGTVIIYLNEDFEGGETFFNKLDIKIKPKQGSVLFFAYNYEDQTNKLTEHSGQPVLQGTKFIATCWIRQFPFN